MPADTVTTTPCDVLAPCATARVVDDATVDVLGCRVVAGAANDILAHRGLDRRLAARGILYVPDFVANAGGVVQIHAVRAGWDEPATHAAVLRIGERVDAMLRRASAEGCTPLEVAERVASERIGRSVQIPA